MIIYRYGTLTGERDAISPDQVVARSTRKRVVELLLIHHSMLMLLTFSYEIYRQPTAGAQSVHVKGSQFVSLSDDCNDDHGDKIFYKAI